MTDPSRTTSGLDLTFVRAWFLRYWLAVWFASISLVRASVLVTAEPGFDARLYLRATRTWLDGQDPWILIGPQRFAAPPPTLIPMAPVALLPEDLGVAILLIAAVAGAIATIRLLHLPWWWLLFPPLVDGMWNGNPQTLLVPLILVGAGPIAVFLKVYAIVPIALTLRWRALVVTGTLLLVTAPILPWASYFGQFADLSTVLATQSDGGLSATAIPLLIPVAAIALVFCGRERAAWMAVPVLWPSTQWYYSTLAMPALSSIAAALMAIPVPGFAVVAAAIVVAAEHRRSASTSLVADWKPGILGRP